MSSFAGLNASEQRQLEERMQKRQVKEFMGLVHNMFETCFVSCIDDFSSKALSSRETGCISRCVQKSLATTQRLSERFQENNQAMSNGPSR